MSDPDSGRKSDPKKDRRPNRLGRESSPYLRQHAFNPVDWYPWGPEALERSKRLDRPIFLSVGYAACHWCHVMEKESFEDAETAKLLNERFVPVKVDREERPDVDHLYMQAVQALTQRGGWPMSVFLTPSGAPFFAGTYFPLEDRHGMPSFKRILRGVQAAWEKQRSEVEKSAAQLVSALRDINAPKTDGTAEVGDVALVDAGARQWFAGYDPRHGGLGGAPKFFHGDAWRLLLRSARRTGDGKMLRAVEHTLDAIASGGIYDQLRGGFHRYSTDMRWHVPHFEKMLYDNGLLPPWFLEAASAIPSASARWIATVRETLDWLLDEMAGPEGGFAATLDADSEGEEGKFYVWTAAEIETAVGDGEAARAFSMRYGVTKEGNWPESGKDSNVLFRAKTLEEVASATKNDVDSVEASIALARRRLLAARATRMRPERDDKIVLPWNAFVIDALAQAARVTGEARYQRAAEEAYAFLGRKLRRDDAAGLRLYHSYKDGAAKVPAFLDGYGAFGLAALALFSATGTPAYLHDAVAASDAVGSRFRDASGDFTFSANDAESLVTPVFDRHDGATPSALSLAVGALVGTYRATGLERFRRLAEVALGRQGELLRKAPEAVPSLLLALDRLVGDEETCVLVEGEGAEGFAEAFEAVSRIVAPERTVLPFTKAAQADSVLAAFPVFVGKTAPKGVEALYRCAGFRCDAPVVGAAAIERA